MNKSNTVQPIKEPSFNTCVIEASSGEYEASYSVDGTEITLGRYTSAHEANIAALLGVQAYFRNLPSRK